MYGFTMACIDSIIQVKTLYHTEKARIWLPIAFWHTY